MTAEWQVDGKQWDWALRDQSGGYYGNSGKKLYRPGLEKNRYGEEWMDLSSI